MDRHVLLRYPSPGWARATFSRLHPGGHAAVYGCIRDAIQAEDAGFEVRDCLTVLGPLVHRVWLFRRPVEEPTVAAQMLATGTGGIWIDGCRVRGGDSVQQSAGAVGGYHGSPTVYEKGTGRLYGEAGRWPANLVLVHTLGCRQEGVKKVKGHPGYPNGPGGKSFQYSSDKRGSEVRPNAWLGHSDAEGLETIPAWVCQPGCPVLAMDTQSGVSTSGAMRHEVPAYEGESTTAFLRGRSGPSNQHGGTGGASRFFPQFGSEDELDAWLTHLLVGKHLV